LTGRETGGRDPYLRRKGRSSIQEGMGAVDYEHKKGEKLLKKSKGWACPIVR